MIVLDTHILIWWVDDNEKLSNKSKTIISKAQKNKTPIIISSITAWEISMLINKGRLCLSMDVDKWIEAVSKIECVEFIPVNNQIAINSTRLPNLEHKDPADRIIIATARTLGATLITADEKILAYPQVKTIF